MGKNPEQKIKDRIDELEKRKSEEEKVLCEIQETLKKADGQRHTHPEESRRWYKIVDHLEETLVEVKAKLTEYNVLINNEKKNLQKYIESQGNKTEAPDTESSEKDLPSRTKEHTTEHVLKTLSEEGKQLTAMALELGQQYQDEADEKKALIKRGLAKQKIFEKKQRKRRLPAMEKGNSFTKQRKMATLRNALDKVKSDKINHLTLQEIELLLDCFTLMLRKLVMDPTDKRVLAIVGRTIHETEDTLEKLLERRSNLNAKRFR